MNVTQEALKTIINFMVDNFSPTLVYLFGSANAGNFRQDSDIDIAFLSEEDVPDYDLLMKAQQLGDQLSRDVDLIFLNKATTVLKSQIVGTGEIIYEVDRNRTYDFNIRSLKEYALLNEERYKIIQQVAKEGKIFE